MVDRVRKSRASRLLRIFYFAVVALILALGVVFELEVVHDGVSPGELGSLDGQIEAIPTNPSVILADLQAGSPDSVADTVSGSLTSTEPPPPALVAPSTTTITTSPEGHISSSSTSVSTSVTAADETSTTSDTSAAIQQDPEPSASNGGWYLVFSDEFQTLNREVWHTSYEWHPVVINDELEYYSGDQVSVDDGSLVLTASGTPQGGQPYSSGMISSHDRFSFTYGRVEMRSQLPTGRGFWPAFWLMPADHTWPPEIDIMEARGQEPNTVSCAFHWLEGSDLRSFSQLYSGPDYTASFHTFALDWEPDKLTWFVDGEPCATYTDASRIPQKAMYVIANLAVGGTFVGPPDAETTFPSSYVIDYIRVWQREAS